MPILQVIKNFLGSEKGILALALIIGATVLTALGKMPLPEWQEYTIYIFGIYVSGKSIQGAAAAIAGAKRNNGDSVADDDVDSDDAAASDAAGDAE